MPLFRKKPVVIEARQITSATFDAPHPNPEHFPGIVYDPVTLTVRIQTPEGEMIGKMGDWIIKGVKGELYPCRADIFEATYESSDTVSDQLRDRGEQVIHKW